MGTCVYKKNKVANNESPQNEMRIKMQQHLEFLNKKNEGTPRLSISDSSIYKRRRTLSNAIVRKNSEESPEND